MSNEKTYKMSASKKLYLVNGSQDGILGVFSNVKLAYACAFDYAHDACDTDTKNDSYSKTCKAIGKYGYCEIGDGYGVAYITLQYLNQC